MFVGLWTILILLAGVAMIAMMVGAADRDGKVSQPPEHPGFSPPARRLNV